MKYSILSLILTLLFLGHGDLLAANDFRERIYVQTDKQVYLAGELLWLKLCVTDATGIPVSVKWGMWSCSMNRQPWYKRK